MPAESFHEQIAAALKTLLEGIVAGADYWYTFNSATTKVARTSFYTENDLKVGYEQIVLIRPGEETVREFSTGDPSTGGGMRGVMEVFVEINKRFEAATENPFEEASPTRWQLVNRAIRDVLRRVFLDGVTVTGLAVNVAEESLVIDRSQFMAKWARAELRFLISYDFMAATP